MLQFHCREVLIKFIGHTKNGERIQVTEHPGTNYFMVQQDPVRLVVFYCNSNGNVLKTIVYNWNTVEEYTCENHVTVKEAPQAEGASANG